MPGDIPRDYDPRVLDAGLRPDTITMAHEREAETFLRAWEWGDPAGPRDTCLFCDGWRPGRPEFLAPYDSPVAHGHSDACALARLLRLLRREG